MSRRSPLKTSSRVKTFCCWRLTKGAHAGRMCGESVLKVAPSDYCPKHSIAIMGAIAEAEIKLLNTIKAGRG